MERIESGGLKSFVYPKGYEPERDLEFEKRIDIAKKKAERRMRREAKEHEEEMRALKIRRILNRVLAVVFSISFVLLAYQTYNWDFATVILITTIVMFFLALIWIVKISEGEW